MKTKTIEDFLLENANSNRIPILDENVWAEINRLWSKAQFRSEFAKYVIKHKPEFPFMEVSKEKMEERFQSLKMMNSSEFILTNFSNVVEKYPDYKYPFSQYGKLVIDLHNKFNPVSNYFQQKNRMACGSYGFKSPLEIWTNQSELEKMNWTFWRLGNKSIGLTEYRGSFRLGAYVATQFKPNVAKTFYDLTRAKTVCDTSCGWGDRLAGFYATPIAESYYGCDPNPTTFETYKLQCQEYERLLGGTPRLTEKEDYFECTGKKHVVIFRKPAEDMIWPLVEFDCTFTSPPYFSTEQYNKGGDKEEDQSWNRYAEYDKWKLGFYFPMMDKVWERTRSGGFVCINIMDPQVRNKRYRACDDLVDYMKEKSDCRFIGQVGMRIKQRPKKLDTVTLRQHLSTIFIENVWCFSKDIEANFHLPTLENLFI
jgi:hypothetical protein